MPNRFSNVKNEKTTTPQQRQITRKEKLNKIHENIKVKMPQKAKNSTNKSNKVSSNKLKLLIT
ncbi:MAG: hypothetical protein K2L47_02590, partial [Clostridia bacterium]|nr:hypothetical protein [Clostridia bacterium]